MGAIFVLKRYIFFLLTNVHLSQAPCTLNHKSSAARLSEIGKMQCFSFFYTSSCKLSPCFNTSRLQSFSFGLHFLLSLLLRPIRSIRVRKPLINAEVSS